MGNNFLNNRRTIGPAINNCNGKATTTLIVLDLHSDALQHQKVT